jgi:hypothetical protein
MGFKLGNEKRNYGKSSPIKRGSLREGIDGEARDDGTIVISNKIKPGSKKFERVVKHEMQHKRDMDSGRAAYGENWVAWEGDIFMRHNIDGEAVIDGPAGRLPEGHPDHPWEQAAIKAEKE